MAASPVEMLQKYLNVKYIDFTCDNKKYHTVNNDSCFKGKRFEKTK